MPEKSYNSFRLFQEFMSRKVFRVNKKYSAAWLTPILLICLIQGCTEPGWVSQTGGISDSSQGDWVLWDVWFLDANKGFAVGDYGVILRTTDGGITWNSQLTGTGNRLAGISFSDSLHGWIVGFKTILHTNDGGNTWTRQAKEITEDSNKVSNFSEVFSIDSNTAWVVCEVGESGIIYNTTDGGLTWIPQKTGVRTFIWDVFFTSPDTGSAVGGWCDNCNGGPYYSGYILHTTNGGATWHLQYHDTSVIGFEGIDFIDALTGVVVGARGTILCTTDGGDTWTRQASGTTVNLRDVCFVNADTGFVVGGESFPPYMGGTILRTTDGGKTWTKQESATKYSLTEAYFTDTKTGIAIGFRTILRTTSGGEPVPRKGQGGLVRN